MRSRLLICGLVSVLVGLGDDKPAEKGSAASAEAKPVADAPANAEAEKRVELNLLGKTDAASGESRRNENVQFNLIDNNALKELNVRLGTTATIVEEFQADRGYFGVEFGNRPAAPLHVGPARVSALHGELFELHNNSIFSARSFFQVGN